MIFCLREFWVILEALSAGRLADGGNVAGKNFLDVLTLVGMHTHQATDTLAPAAVGVVDGLAGAQYARVDTNVRQAADKGVGDDLEDETGKGFVVIRAALDGRARVRVGALHRRDILRAGQVAHDGIEQKLNTLVVKLIG